MCHCIKSQSWVTQPFIACCHVYTGVTWCLAAEVVAAAAHLTHWAWPAGWGAPQRWCCPPTARLGTGSCPRPPSLPQWWSSCHRKPGAWGLGSEQGVVCAWTTGRSTQNWSLTPLCTAATRTHQGRCLTPGATQTRWPSAPLQEDGNSIMVFCFSCLGQTYCRCVYETGARLSVCLLSLPVPLDAATWRTNAATPEIQRNDFTQTRTSPYILLYCHRLFLSHRWHFGYNVFSLLLCQSGVKCNNMNTTSSSDGLFPYGGTPDSQSWSTTDIGLYNQDNIKLKRSSSPQADLIHPIPTIYFCKS